MRESSEKQKFDAEEEHPFRGNLEPIRYNLTQIKELKSRPDKLVREWRVESIKDREDVDRRIAEIKKDMEVFDTIRDNYGIDVVKTELVLGGYKANPKMYLVVDKIFGKDLDKIEKLPDDTAEVLDQLFASMVQYYFDIYKNGGNYWWDFGINQIVYGHKYGEDKDKFYVVDVEPRVYNYNKHSAAQNELLFGRFQIIIEDLCLLSRQNKFTLPPGSQVGGFNMPAKFVKSQAFLKDVFNHIPKSEPSYMYIRNAVKMFEQLPQ